jgi:hypothetical protein
MLLSFPAVNGEGHMSIVSQLFQIKIGGNVCLWHIGSSMPYQRCMADGMFQDRILGESMWHSSENVFEDVMWAFGFSKIVKEIAIIIKHQKNNMARRHIDFGSNKKM